MLGDVGDLKEDVGETLGRPWGDLGETLGETLGRPWGDLGEPLGRPWGVRWGRCGVVPANACKSAVRLRVK